MADIHRYVDNTVGASGDGTVSSPWKYLWNIAFTAGTNNVAADIAAGNQVYLHLKRGCLFGTPTAGTATGDYMNVTAGGSSDSIRVIINGGDPSLYGGSASFGAGGANAIINNWYEIITASWTANDPVAGTYSAAWTANTPVRLFKNTKNTAGLRTRGSAADALNENEWFHVGAATNKVYFRPPGGEAPGDASNKIYLWIKNSGITINAGKDYVTVRNFTILGSNSANIVMSGSYGKVENNDLSEAYSGVRIVGNGATGNVVGGESGKGNTVYATWGDAGIYHIGSTTSVTDSTISYNTIHDGCNHNVNLGDSHAIGVNSLGGGDDVIVEHNTIYNWGPTTALAASGNTIEIYSSQSTIVRYNYLYNNYSGGIGVTTNSHNSSVYNNIMYNNGRLATTTSGVALNDLRLGTSTGLFVCNNVCLNSNSETATTGAAIYYMGAGAYNDWTVANNIIAKPTNSSMVYMEAGNWAGSTIDNNLFVGADGNFYYAGGTHDFASWKTDKSYDASSQLVANIAAVKFINAGGSYSLVTDFKLRADSPAINAGVAVGLTTDYAGTPVPFASAPDIGAYEWVGGGGGSSLGLGLSGGHRPPWWNRRRR